MKASTATNKDELVRELERRMADDVKSMSGVPAPYPISSIQLNEMLDRFTYHPPMPAQPERYALLRSYALGLSVEILTSTPPSREQALALTKLEECVMWANSAIARNEGPRRAA